MQMLHSHRWREALAAAPTHPWLANELANGLWLDDALAEALSWARWATRPQPQAVNPLAWRSLGNVLLDLGRYAEANRAYQQADPQGSDPATQFNRSKTQLGLGEWALAWQLAEQRLQLDPLPDGVFTGPWWQGWPQAGTVLAWSEQGLGDCLQFVRWLPSLLERGVHVELLVERPLQRLLEQGLAWMGPRLRVNERPKDGTALPGCHGSLLSLPWRLQRPEPPWFGPQGYLRLPAEPPRPGRRPRLGLVWGAGRYLDGHARERDYRRKSLLGSPLLELLNALAQRPIELVLLQVGPDREEAKPAGAIWREQLDPRADFLELAQALQQLDLLLCVDTAAAHLAGAMGLDTWLLLPWAAASRWQRHSSRTPWYPSLRLWRQPRHGDWSGLFPELLAALDSRWNSSS
jgi:hypothetical protein